MLKKLNFNPIYQIQELLLFQKDKLPTILRSKYLTVLFLSTNQAFQYTTCMIFLFDLQKEPFFQLIIDINFIEMSRENVYNPLLKLLQSQNNLCDKKPYPKLFSQAQSKQDFFTLKKNNIKKSVSNAILEDNKRRLSLNKKDSQNSYQQSWQQQINNSCDIYLSNSIDDDVKTTSTKSYDTHEEIKIYKNTNIKKKKEIQLIQANKTNDLTEFKRQNLKNVKVDKLIQNSTFKSQFFILNQQGQIKSQKINKSDILLKFNENIKKKAVMIPTPKIKHFNIFPKPIGQGTYSKVYKAIHKKTGMLCAIKVMQKQQIIRLNLIDNLIEQIKIMSFYQHQNIAKLWGFFQQESKFYMIMQYCTDGELYSIIKQFNSTKKMNLKQYHQKLSYIRQICGAIQFLHENKIMHRDIKPQNILLTMNGCAKLSDFGWAKIIQNPADQLRRTLCGTPLYLAPEQIRQSQYSKSVDLWAVGILTYQLLTGKIPFVIESIQDLHKIVNQQVTFEQIQCFPYAQQFVSLLLEKDGSKRLGIERLTEHKFFQVLDQLNEQYFMYQLEFDRFI